MAFAVHGTAELAFAGAAAGLLIANNPVAGALAGAIVVAGLIALLGGRPRERDSAIGVILAFVMGMGVLLLGYYRGFATAATNILFGNIFGVSGDQLIVLLVIGLLVVTVMGIWYRPLLFASVDPDQHRSPAYSAGPCHGSQRRQSARPLPGGLAKATRKRWLALECEVR
jgi:zinc/manganese transport system permease protein